MKKVFFTLAILFFWLSMFSQSDSLYVQQINDSTFMKVVVSFDALGRETGIQKEYYDSIGFGDFIFDLTINADNSFSQAEKGLVDYERGILNAKRTFNFLRKDFQDFTGKNYAVELTERLKDNIKGSWRLVIGKEKFDIETNNGGKVFNDVDSDKKAKITFKQVGKLTLSQSGNNDYFFSEDVEFEENENGNWSGITLVKNKATKVFLRRRN